MITRPKKDDLRPYQLTGKNYACWYDIGVRIGSYSQNLVGNALCNGSTVFPASVDLITVEMINRVAKDFDLQFTREPR